MSNKEDKNIKEIGKIETGISITHSAVQQFILSDEEINQRKENFNKTIEPFIRERLKVENLFSRRIIVTGKNEVEFKIHWTPEAKEYVKMIDEIIECIRKECFKTYNVNDNNA